MIEIAHVIPDILLILLILLSLMMEVCTFCSFRIKKDNGKSEISRYLNPFDGLSSVLNCQFVLVLL